MLKKKWWSRAAAWVWTQLTRLLRWLWTQILEHWKTLSLATFLASTFVSVIIALIVKLEEPLANIDQHVEGMRDDMKASREMTDSLLHALVQRHMDLMQREMEHLQEHIDHDHR